MDKSTDLDKSVDLDNCVQLDKFAQLKRFAQDIYKELGPGHRECVYHRAFELELRTNEVPYECEVVVPLFYKGYFLSHLRLDLVVAKKFIVELKATKSIKDDDVLQLKRYMETTGMQYGMLVNFGSSELRQETFEISDVVGLHPEEQC